MRNSVVSLVGAIVLTVLAGGAIAADADTARLKDGNTGPDWAGPGRTFGEQHFSPLTEINDKNVAKLGLAWFIDLHPTHTVSEPLVVDGVMYYTTGSGNLHAADAKTGKSLWDFDAKSPEVAGKKLRFAWGSRGLSYWNGKVFVGTMDGRLIAVDTKTGKQVWSAQTVDPNDVNYITGAPRAFNGKVIIGFGGADFGNSRGYVSCYDTETGKLLWRWFIVPGDPAKGFENAAMEMAAKTWFGEWWKMGGGGAVWNAMAYDPDTNSVFLGTGNGGPWNHKARSQGKGDNLFLASIVALDGDTGKYKWHYQVSPGESWDHSAAMDIQFADLKIDGKDRKVLIQVPKNGFFYVIDRTNGQLISAEPIVKVNWASKIDLKTGRPVENPAARYPDGTTFTMWPSGNGGHNWYPMAYSPQTKLAYVPVLERAMTYADWELKDNRWQKLQPIGTIQSATMNSLPDVDDPLNRTSRLEAWNPVTQKRVWSQQMVSTEGGGVAATAGNLVFQGQPDGTFTAYAADTGKKLWVFQANAPVLAPPISYAVGGRQYVTVLTGITGHTALVGADLRDFHADYRTMERRVLTFALDGKTKLPPRAHERQPPIDDPDYKANEAQEARGMGGFHTSCFVCHGFFAEPGGSAPDLRSSPFALSADSFRSVVKEGALLSAGMPVFPELSDAQLEDIRQYIRSRAAVWRNEKAAAKAKPGVSQ